MASLLAPIENTPFVGGTPNSYITVDVNGLQVTLNGVDGELLTWDASGVPATIAAGTATHVLTSNGPGAAPTFQAAAGGGDVSKVGTPVDNQIGVWTGDGTIEGDANLTWNGSALVVGNTGFIYPGNGITSATPTYGVVRGTGGSGTNVVGATVYIGPGASTGSASPGTVTIQGTTSGASGTTPQTFGTIATFKDSKVGIGTVNPGRALDIDITASDLGVMRLKNSAADGYVSFDAYDNTAALALQFGIGNASVATTSLQSTAYLGPRLATSPLILFSYNNITTPEITIRNSVVYFGSGYTSATPTDGQIQGTGGSGTDIAGADLIIAPGQSTGNATPSTVVIKGTVAGITGTTPQSLVDMVTITDNTMVAGNLTFGEWVFTATYGFIGHSDLDHSVPGNYQFLCSPTGSAYVNAASGGTVYIRVNNVTSLAVNAAGITASAQIILGTGISIDGSSTSGYRGRWFMNPTNTNGFLDTLTSGQSFTLRERTTTNIPFVIEEAAAQTADVFQVHTSAAAVLTRIDKDGLLFFGDNGGDPTAGASEAGLFAKDVDSVARMHTVDEDDVISPLTKCYGEINVETNATVTTIASSSTDFSNKVQVTVFNTNAAASQGTTPDHTNDHITIDIAGVYLINIQMSFSGNASNKYSFAAFKNNGATQLGTRATRMLGSGGDVGCASTLAVVSLAKNDTVEVWIQNESAGNNATVEDCVLSVVRVG